VILYSEVYHLMILTGMMVFCEGVLKAVNLSLKVYLVFMF